LALREVLNVTDAPAEIGVGVNECLQCLPGALVAVAYGFNRKIHAEFVFLFGGHND
jgi:hypothetical protein